MNVPGQELPTVAVVLVTWALVVLLTLNIVVVLDRLAEPVPLVLRFFVWYLRRPQAWYLTAAQLERPAAKPKRTVVLLLVFVLLLQFAPLVGLLWPATVSIIVRAECGLCLLGELAWLWYLRTHLVT